MKFAIIAAGEGSRLASAGIRTPKPLVEINGEKLIDRLIRIFLANDASEIVVICNDITSMVGTRHSSAGVTTAEKLAAVTSSLMNTRIALRAVRPDAAALL